METFFYVAGAVLVLLALVISALGLRSDRFPSAGILRVGVLIVFVVVGVTAYAAVQLSEDEQELRLEEENVLAAEEAEVTTEENADEDGGAPNTSSSEIDGGDETDVRDDASEDLEGGQEVFLTNGCGSCHTLGVLGGEAAGQIGPNLDESLVDKDTAYIETAIVDPNSEIAEGFGPDIMPQDYGETIEAQDLASLITFLEASTQSDKQINENADTGSSE